MKPVVAHSKDHGTAFYYGRAAPVELMAHFDQVVVEADNFSNGDLVALQERGTVVYAYLSICEVNRHRAWFKDLPPQWFLGNNAYWNSGVMDLTRSEWRSYLIKNWAGPLWMSGYRAFFLDTLDSYHAYLKDEEELRHQDKALISIIHALHKEYPGIKLMMNRGFDILPQVAHLVVGVVAESLYRGWDPKEKRYGEVSETQRQWLLKKLIEVRTRFDLPVVVIDYLPPHERELARKIAGQITALGFTPWISNSSLDTICLATNKDTGDALFVCK